MSSVCRAARGCCPRFCRVALCSVIEPFKGLCPVPRLLAPRRGGARLFALRRACVAVARSLGGGRIKEESGCPLSLLLSVCRCLSKPLRPPEINRTRVLCGAASRSLRSLLQRKTATVGKSHESLSLPPALRNVQAEPSCPRPRLLALLVLTVGAAAAHTRRFRSPAAALPCAPFLPGSLHQRPPRPEAAPSTLCLSSFRVGELVLLTTEALVRFARSRGKIGNRQSVRAPTARRQGMQPLQSGNR